MLTQGLLDIFFSMALDTGPESRLGNVEVRASSLFPHWMNHNFEIYNDVGLGDLIDAPEPEIDDVTLSTTHVYVVKGVYHVMELMQQRLLNQLPSFAEVKPLIESMCIFFHQCHSREAFTHSLTGPRLLWKPAFSSGPPLFEGGRVWGVLLKLTIYFRRRKMIIVGSGYFNVDRAF